MNVNNLMRAAPASGAYRAVGALHQVPRQPDMTYLLLVGSGPLRRTWVLAAEEIAGTGHRGQSAGTAGPLELCAVAFGVFRLALQALVRQTRGWL